MESNLYRFVLRYSARQQVWLTILAILSFPFLYAFYEVPKMIVNQAIQGSPTDFPVERFGMTLEQLEFLLALCCLFLALVFVNQGFKYYVNVYRGLVGERMLRRLRYLLFARVLRFPQPTFRRMSSGEIIQMITAEVERLGGFIGDAFSVPVYQGGTLLVILAFLFVQNPYMALAAVSLYPLQMYVIPRLQAKVNNLAKERVRLVRQLSDRVGEVVGGVQEVHAHDTARYELAAFTDRLGAIFDVRYKIYIWKFVIKFVNNFINQLGPFFFYSIGGYFVIIGTLEIGTLIAAIAAHKDLAGPWKELLNYYQQQQDSRIKYEQVVAQFAPEGLLDEALQLDPPDQVPALRGELAVNNVSLKDESDILSVANVSLSLPLDAHVAVVGPGGGGKEDLGMLLARLLHPTSGSIRFGDERGDSLHEAITGQRIAYVGSAAFMFTTTVRENLLYGLKHRPLREPSPDTPEGVAWEQARAEAHAAGNIELNFDADWVDYAAAGAESPEALSEVAVEVLRQVDMADDIYALGLRGTIDPAQQPEIAARILEARARVRTRLGEDGFDGLVEPFNKDRYNDNATVAENLLFGTPVGGAFNMDRMAENAYVLQILDQAGLTHDLLNRGVQVAETMVELFADIPPGHPFFEQFSFISSDDLPDYQTILGRISKGSLDSLSAEDRTLLLSLPFKLIPTRHRLDIIDDDLRRRLVEARKLFAENLPENLRGAVEFFDADAYNAAATLQDNILFGKMIYGQAESAERVGALLSGVIDELNLRQTVMEVGLDFHVGIAGSRLSAAQRQKLALARCLLRQPDLLIVNEATAALDNSAQVRILDNVLRLREGRGLVWILHRVDMAERFDHVIVMQDGKVVEHGRFTELNREGSQLTALLRAA